MLKGKAAVVTGSTSGIGLGIAEGLAAAGVDIVLNGFGDPVGIKRAQTDLANRHGVRVLYSREGVIADDVIRELVAAEPTGRPVVVVTSDNAVVADVVRDGARALHYNPGALTRLLGRF